MIYAWIATPAPNGRRVVRVKVEAVSRCREWVRVRWPYSAAVGGGWMDPTWMREADLYANHETRGGGFELSGNPNTRSLPTDEEFRPEAPSPLAPRPVWVKYCKTYRIGLPLEHRRPGQSVFGDDG